MPEDFVSSNEVLNSWKEIAEYLHRGVRTVQRWEIELALPVRRPRGKSRSAVLALRPELDEWIRNCPQEKREAVEDGAPVENGGGLRQNHDTTELLVELRTLRSSLVKNRKDVHQALTELMANVRRIPLLAPPPSTGRGAVCLEP